jgi:hypothetical protein
MRALARRADKPDELIDRRPCDPLNVQLLGGEREQGLRALMLYRADLWARHAHLAQFAPRVLAALDLNAAAGDQPLLDAIRYVEVNRQRPVVPDAPLGVLSPTYRAWVVDEHGRTVGTRCSTSAAPSTTPQTGRPAAVQRPASPRAG